MWLPVALSVAAGWASRRPSQPSLFRGAVPPRNGLTSAPSAEGGWPSIRAANRILTPRSSEHAPRSSWAATAPAPPTPTRLESIAVARDGRWHRIWACHPHDLEGLTPEYGRERTARCHYCSRRGVDQRPCICGHSWIWHRVSHPTRCDYIDCACRAFTPDDGDEESRRRESKRAAIGRLMTRNADRQRWVGRGRLPPRTCSPDGASAEEADPDREQPRRS